MFTKDKKSKHFLSLTLIISLLVTSVFWGNGEDTVLALETTSAAEDKEQIEELTLPVDPQVEDDSYEGYIVLIEDGKTSKVDEDALEDYDSTPDNKLVLVDEPEDTLDFVDPDYVELIEPNYIREASGEVSAIAQGTETTKNTTEYKMIKAFDAWNRGFSGTGASIAVFDTGLNFDHPGFADSNKDGKFYNFVGNYRISNIPSDLPSVIDGYSIGHGTPVVGLIAANGDSSVQGIAYESTVSMGRIMDNSGRGSVADFIWALYYYMAKNGPPDVLNMSFGSSAYSEIEYQYISDLTNAGTIAIAASGNSGKSGSPYDYPANYDNVIAVGSVNRTTNPSSAVVSDFSTKNSSVLVSAPGNGITSLSNNKEYLTYKGTSFSAPLVAGTAALAAKYIQGTTDAERKYNQSRFLTLLKTTSTDASSRGYDFNTGYGVINVDKLATTASSSGINTPKSYQIAYRTNGGKFTGPAPTIHTEGTTTTLTKNLTRTGYTFSHWINESGTKVTKITGSRNISLRAVWTPKTYKLVFYGNGGKVQVYSKAVKYNTAISTLTSPKYRKGYNFLGWFDKKSGGSQYYKGRKYTTVGNKALYAHWTKHKIVKFYPNGGIVSKYGKAIVKGKKFGTLPTPSRTGYKFLGWYTKKTGGSKVTANTKVSKKANYILYARWKKK